MNRPLVSVLIPVYNVESYLSECLDSIVNQTLKEIEIVLLNDGSTDSSREIAEKHRLSDSRITLLDQENKGLGAARNVLLSHATGKYVIFIDSDDYIAPQTVEALYERAQQDETDILFYNGKAFLDYDGRIQFKNGSYFPLCKSDEGPVLSGLEFAARTSGVVSAVLKLYDREFLIKNNLHFPERTLGEDVAFFYSAMIDAQRVAYIDFVGYFRRYRANSIMTGGGIGNMNDRLDNFHQISDLIPRISDTKYRKIIASQLTAYACGLWIMIMSRKEKSKRQVLLSNFYNNGLHLFISQHKSGFMQTCASMLIALPASFDGLKAVACVIVKKIFQSKTKLFQ